MTTSLIILGLLLAGALYAVNTYKKLIAIKHNVVKSWVKIDVLLRQRHDELPKLIDICKQYMEYEQDTLRKIMLARSAVSRARENEDVASLGAAETSLRLGLGALFAVAEAYPDLKAHQSFQSSSDRIKSLESTITDQREFYNESVSINNARIKQFPDLLIANWFDFMPMNLLAFTEEEITDVNVVSLFN